MTFQQFNVNNVLSSVDAASSSELVGTYSNGSLNNGVGATFTFPTGPFVVDTIVVEAGMSVLLKDQTNSNENGIYFCNQKGDSSTPAILTRRDDFHSLEQLNPGQFFSVANGQDNKGAIFILVEPLPLYLGIDPMIFGNVLPNEIAVVLDTANPGNISGLDVSISDSVAINDAGANLTAVRGAVYPSGVTQGSEMNGVQGLIQSSGGTYESGANNISAVSALLDFNASGSEIDGAVINGIFSKFNGASVDTNLTNVNMFKSFNDTLQSVGSHYYMWGPADYAFSLQGVTGNYYLISGTAAGSAGDTAHCNAPRVIKILANGIEIGYIPVFLSNA